MNSTDIEVREALISAYNNAETEDEKAQVKAQLFETLSERERAVYLSIDRMALEIAHLDNTKKALEVRYDQAKALCEIYGFPIGEKLTAGNNTVQLNNTVTVLDTEALSSMADKDVVVAEAVRLAIETKRAKVTIDTLTMTDLKAFFKNAPTTAKRKLASYVKPRRA